MAAFVATETLNSFFRFSWRKDLKLIAALLPAHYTTDAPIDPTNANHIAELEQHVKLLQAEKAVLLEALQK
jgi:hypothetical protein